MNKKNKKILTVVACIVGGIILFAINIFPYFLENSSSDQQDGSAKVNYSVNLDSIWDLGKLKDIGKEPTEEDLEPYYRDNLQDALWDGRIIREEEEQYRRNIDEIIKEIESDDGVLLFYKSVKNNKMISLNVCKFNLREIDGIKQYVAIYSSHEKSIKDSKKYNYSTDKEAVREYLKTIPYAQDFSLDQNKKILYGYSETESIYSLKIEGQPPTEIVPYEEFGNTCYLWYYLDLQTNRKQPSEMVVDMDE